MTHSLHTEQAADERMEGAVGLLDRVLDGGRTQKAVAPAPGDLDAATIRQLARAGADLSQPRETLHYLYVGREADAATAKVRLAGEGRAIETRPAATGGGWLVLLETDMVVGLDAIHALRAEIESVASQVGGEYDGREAAVPEAAPG